MIDEIEHINAGRVVPLPDMWPDRVEDIAYIGDKKSPYDEGEHFKRALILHRRDVQPDELRRFHCVEYVLIINTLIDERLSFNHFDTVKELIIHRSRFGITLPDFGPIRKIVAFMENPNEDDPGGRIYFEKLLASTSKREMEISAYLPVTGDHTIEGWLGRGLELFTHPNTLEETTFRLSNCPKLKSFWFLGTSKRRTCVVISKLPRLEVLGCEGMKKLEIEEGMISLKSLRLYLCNIPQHERHEAVVGLENCVSLHILAMKGYHMTDFRTFSQNSDMKTIDVRYGILSSLVGVEYIHRLERLEITETPLAREICEVLCRIERGIPGEEDALQSLLHQVDLGKVRIITGVDWADRKLQEFGSRVI